MIKVRILLCVSAALLAISSASAQNLLVGPESVAFDSLNNRYLVSGWGNAAVIAIDLEGNQTEFVAFSDMTLGNCISGTMFYTTLGISPTHILGFDLTTDTEVFDVAVPGSTQIDGMTTDTSGYLYAANMEREEATGNRIYRVNLSTGASELFAEAGMPDGTQDVIFDAVSNRLLAVGFHDLSPIVSISLPDGIVTDFNTDSPGGFDGITIDRDGYVYTSHFDSGLVYRWEPDGSARVTLSSGHIGPAGLDYNWRDEVLAVPNADGNTISYIRLGDPDSDDIPWCQDNCPETYNPDQANADGDALGDDCDHCPSTANQRPEGMIAGGEFNLTGGVEANGAAWFEGEVGWPLGMGTDDDVQALLFYGGDLIAGGRFTTAGGVDANHIAAWDGGAWRPLGPGLDGEVLALTIYEGDLIASGKFRHAGSLDANRIARWDGSSWYAMGSGMNSIVFSLLVHDGELLAGGQFSTAGGVSAKSVAKWDGTTWTPIGSGTNGCVLAMTYFGSDLVVGGLFGLAGEIGADFIAGWNGSQWYPLGTGMNGAVNSLTIYDGNLVAGGDFTSSGNLMVANRVASWDGVDWTALGLGVNGSLNAFVFNDGKLVAGGAFTAAGGNGANHLASWGGSAWAPIGAGLNDEVAALVLLEAGQLDLDGDGYDEACDNCPGLYNPAQVDSDGDEIGDLCDFGCCNFRVGDANGVGGDEPTIGDVSVMIDAKFIAGTCISILGCLTEADVNQTGGTNPDCDDITIGDISTLIDYLFITGPTLGLADCP